MRADEKPVNVVSSLDDISAAAVSGSNCNDGVKDSGRVASMVARFGGNSLRDSGSTNRHGTTCDAVGGRRVFGGQAEHFSIVDDVGTDDCYGACASSSLASPANFESKNEVVDINAGESGWDFDRLLRCRLHPDTSCVHIYEPYLGHGCQREVLAHCLDALRRGGVCHVLVCTCFREDDRWSQEDAVAALDQLKAAQARIGLRLDVDVLPSFHRRCIQIWYSADKQQRCTEVTLDVGLHFFQAPRHPTERH